MIRNCKSISRRYFRTLIHFLILCPALLWEKEALAYFPPNRHFTAENGLPGSEVHALLQDKQGYMWFATENGVCRYNGYEFTTFTTHEGLTDNVVFRMIGDHKGRVWFSTFSKGICYYDNGKFFPAPVNDQVIKICGNSWVQSMYVDKGDTLWFTVRSKPRVIFRVWNNKLYSDSISIAGNYTDNGKLVKKLEGGFLYEGARFEGRFVKEEDISVKREKDLISISAPGAEITACIAMPGGSFIAATPYNLVEFRDESVTKYTKRSTRNINSLYFDKYGNLWEGSTDGVYCYPGGKLDEEKAVRYFEGKAISSVMQDSEGNYWFATLQEGVYFVPSFTFGLFDTQNGLKEDKITALTVGKGNVWFCTYSGYLYKAGIDLKPQEIVYASKPSYQYDMLAHPGGRIWLASLHVIDKDKPLGFAVGVIQNVKAFAESRDGGIWIGSASGFVKMKDEKIVEEHRWDVFNQRVLAIYEDKEGVTWLGTLRGLFRYDGKEIVHHTGWPVLEDADIQVITQTPRGSLVFGTNGQGIFICQGNCIMQVSRELNGIASNNVRSIYADSDTLLWAATNKGLSRIVIGKDKEISVTNFTMYNGLPSNEINRVSRSGKYIFLATNKGVAYFDPVTMHEEDQPPRIHITGTRINQADTSFTGKMTLNYDENNLIFSFQGISFRAPGNLIYHYRLEGSTGKWASTRDRSVQFSNLPPGDYAFYVTASSEEGMSTATPAVVRFTIKEHFTSTWWFLLLAVLAGIALVSAAVWLVIRSMKSKMEIERRIILSEQKALRSQMNPHFIFNAMNSIQFFISENEKKLAGIFLSKFSLLMRNILDNSMHTLISLEEELACVKIYLELEKLRFGQKFNYTLDIDEAIMLSEVQVPSMLIQPYVENAIWHGLMPKESSGHLMIKLTQHNDDLYCIIEDNGIGRERSAEINSRRQKRHKPAGMKNIEERVQLVNTICKINMKVMVTDVTSNGEVTGTRVELYIPSIHKLRENNLS